ncbi:MAG TPA: hypothetical protein VNE58_14815 [Casimicrobiaceae bacterium]|nr:hypothetical protein [Casimicrobiaceae bacterium]
MASFNDARNPYRVLGRGFKIAAGLAAAVIIGAGILTDEVALRTPIEDRMIASAAREAASSRVAGVVDFDESVERF